MKRACRSHKFQADQIQFSSPTNKTNFIIIFTIKYHWCWSFNSWFTTQPKLASYLLKLEDLLQTDWLRNCTFDLQDKLLLSWMNFLTTMKHCPITHHFLVTPLSTTLLKGAWRSSLRFYRKTDIFPFSTKNIP